MRGDLADEGKVARELNRVTQAVVATDENTPARQVGSVPDSLLVTRDRVRLAERIRSEELVTDAPGCFEFAAAHQLEPGIAEIGHGGGSGKKWARGCLMRATEAHR